ncbi:hypothetical protein EDD21DRAFT_360069 [Dissophora ornata]|nr:hypothetical protein EDD21DRAFT_360069 [Dissophora ornata]
MCTKDQEKKKRLSSRLRFSLPRKAETVGSQRQRLCQISWSCPTRPSNLSSLDQRFLQRCQLDLWGTDYRLHRVVLSLMASWVGTSNRDRDIKASNFKARFFHLPISTSKKDLNIQRKPRRPSSGVETCDTEKAEDKWQCPALCSNHHTS